MPRNETSRRHGRRPSMTHATKVPCTQARGAHVRPESLQARRAMRHAVRGRCGATTAAVAPRAALQSTSQTWTLKVKLRARPPARGRPAELSCVAGPPACAHMRASLNVPISISYPHVSPVPIPIPTFPFSFPGPLDAFGPPLGNDDVRPPSQFAFTFDAHTLTIRTGLLYRVP